MNPCPSSPKYSIDFGPEANCATAISTCSAPASSSTVSSPSTCSRDSRRAATNAATTGTPDHIAAQVAQGFSDRGRRSGTATPAACRASR